MLKDIQIFTNLARQFLDTEDATNFFLSPYADALMNTSLIEYFSHRYRLELDTEEKEVFLRLLRVSPSALYEGLFGSTEQYEATDEHLKTLVNLPMSERNRVKAIMKRNVIGKLIRKTISDFEKPDNNAIYEKREIKGWLTQIILKLAKRNELYFSIQSEDIILRLRATGGIKAGQLVSPTNYDLFIETGDVMAALERPDEAIKDYDEAISHLSEPEKLKTAYNNKGLVLYGLKKWDDAIACYDQALKIDPLLKEAWFNKGLAYAYKGDKKTAAGCFSRAIELDPEYSRAYEELKKVNNSNTAEKL